MLDNESCLLNFADDSNMPIFGLTLAELLDIPDGRLKAVHEWFTKNKSMPNSQKKNLLCLRKKRKGNRIVD